MSSQVQWLLLLHCADKLARCIVWDIFERYTDPGWYTYILHKNSQKVGFKPVCHVLFGCVFLSHFGEEGCRVSFMFTESMCVF